MTQNIHNLFIIFMLAVKKTDWVGFVLSVTEHG